MRGERCALAEESCLWPLRARDPTSSPPSGLERGRLHPIADRYGQPHPQTPINRLRRRMADREWSIFFLLRPGSISGRKNKARDQAPSVKVFTGLDRGDGATVEERDHEAVAARRAQCLLISEVGQARPGELVRVARFPIAEHTFGFLFT